MNQKFAFHNSGSYIREALLESQHD